MTAVLAVRVIWVASFGSATPGRLHFMLPATRWPWVEPPANVIGTYPALTLCQDVNGKVHLLGNANGGATFDDTGAGYTDPWGMQGSVGWRGGLAVFSPDGSALPNGITYHAYLYVVRGGN